VADTRAHAFAALHRPGRPLVLANVWDAASARIVEEAGFPAVATSSAAMAHALGYADGQELPLEELVPAVARIARSVEAFVTVDLEAGYDDEIEELLRIVARVHEAGVVGINLEDWNVRERDVFPLHVAQARIAAVKARFGDTLFVNARTDVYLHGVGAETMRFALATERLRAFAEAGADGVFVPGVHDAETIGRLVAAIDRPLNVLAGIATPPVAELARLGVARVSTGSAPMRRTMAVLRGVAEELRDAGTFGFAHPERTISYVEMNRFFQR
jgi:2-methylisocitrate lyase-like PEP mutase family enzyme